jgi:cyclic pyranopterin phosphate synthase
MFLPGFDPPPACGSAVATRPLADAFGRTISYLRLSVTDRCDCRCVYCMPERMQFLPKRDVLSLEELERLASAFVHLGVRKIRLTGGEPLVRRDVMTLIGSLSRHLGAGGLDELTLTTNGSQLARYARDLADCGVKRINVSLDTLDPQKYRAISRNGELPRVMAGLDAADAAGLKVKLNTVALRGVNEDEVVSLVEWAHGRGYDLTFIEVMPLGGEGRERLDQHVPLTEIAVSLSRRLTLTPTVYQSGGPARYFLARETGGRVGFITPLTQCFCDRCNRVRVACSGKLYLCLGHDDGVDLRAPLRQSLDDEHLIETIRAAIARKPKGHDFAVGIAGARPAAGRAMSVTGG